MALDHSQVSGYRCSKLSLVKIVEDLWLQARVGACLQPQRVLEERHSGHHIGSEGEEGHQNHEPGMHEAGQTQGSAQRGRLLGAVHREGAC